MLKIKDPELKLKNLKLDWGCGWNRESGFLGVDIKDLKCVDIVCDMEGILDLPDESCQIIRSQHFIEHLDIIEVIFIFEEWLRLLKVGGKLHIYFPDMALIQRYVNEARALDFAFGQQVDSWDIHKSFWTLNTMEHYLSLCVENGFHYSKIKEIPFVSVHHHVIPTEKYFLDNDTLQGKVFNWTSGIEAIKAKKDEYAD